MTVNQCNGCGGTYHPVQADGAAYYHVCPPMPGPPHEPAQNMAGHRDENPVQVEVPKPSEILAGVHTVERWADDTIHYFVTMIRHEGAGAKPVEPKG